MASVNRTRTRTRSTESVADGGVESAVSRAIAENVKYVAKSPTANLAAFANYALETFEGTLKTKAERDSFVLGNRLAGLRSRFQDDRRAGKIPNDKTFADYAIESSGIEVPADGPERTALLAGIATYTKYVAYRNSRKASESK